MSDAPKKKAARKKAAAQPATSPSRVSGVCRKPLYEDGHTYAAGDPIELTPARAKALIALVEFPAKEEAAE